MTNTLDIEALSTVIDQQVQLLEKLDVTLYDEYSLLVNKKFENLEHLTTLKLSLLDELRALESKQLTLTETAKVESTNQLLSPKMLLTQLNPDDAPMLSALIEKLSLLTRKCDDQNKVNGMMIQSRRKINQQLLMLLQNSLTQTTTTTYDRNGETTSSSLSGAAVKA